MGGNGLVAVAEQDVDSGLAALLIAGTSLWVVLLRAVLRDRPSAGTVAVLLLIRPGSPSCCWPGRRCRRPPRTPTSTPAVAVVLGALFLSDPLTSNVLGGGAIIIAAVAWVISPEARVRRRPLPAPDAGAGPIAPA